MVTEMHAAPLAVDVYWSRLQECIYLARFKFLSPEIHEAVCESSRPRISQIGEKPLTWQAQHCS